MSRDAIFELGRRAGRLEKNAGIFGAAARLGSKIPRALGPATRAVGKGLGKYESVVGRAASKPGMLGGLASAAKIPGAMARGAHNILQSPRLGRYTVPRLLGFGAGIPASGVGLELAKEHYRGPEDPNRLDWVYQTITGENRFPDSFKNVTHPLGYMARHPLKSTASVIHNRFSDEETPKYVLPPGGGKVYSPREEGIRRMRDLGLLPPEQGEPLYIGPGSVLGEYFGEDPRIRENL